MVVHGELRIEFVSKIQMRNMDSFANQVKCHFIGHTEKPLLADHLFRGGPAHFPNIQRSKVKFILADFSISTPSLKIVR